MSSEATPESIRMELPLARLRVLDLATVVAGPFVGTLLADFGADVLKVELPGRGDTLRTLGPASGDTSYWWAAEARNKRGITLDLRTAAGRDLLLRLAAVSDLLIENFVPGTLEEWGLGPELLRAANPRLVVARVSGFGQTGPYRKRPGYDRIGGAFGGLWHLSGDPDSAPQRPGLSVVDYMTGMLTTIGALIALYTRDAGGSDAGQVIDMALYEAAVRTLEFTASHYSATGTVRGRVGNGGAAQPAGAFQTRDGRWVLLIAGELRMYQRLMQTVERPDLGAEPRFASNAGRIAAQDELNAAIRAWVAAHDLTDVMERLHAADVPLTAANTIADLMADPHVQHRNDFVPLRDPVLGELTVQGVLPKLSETPGAIYRPAPQLGEHNAEVYGGLLGLAATEIERLHDAGVL
jgi:crotonobetainyl-CoA:carnitine CoA-transferase CaiB-like acyl-CoA transferase